MDLIFSAITFQGKSRAAGGENPELKHWCTHGDDECGRVEGLELGEVLEEDRERERHVGRIILDGGEYALYPLCGRRGVDSHQIFFSSFLCKKSVIVQFSACFFSCI